MKNLVLVFAIFSGLYANGQARGNYDFRAASNYVYQPQVVIPAAQSLARPSALGHSQFSIKGLFNCKADAYLAIFAVNQVGKSQREADSLMRAKMEAVQRKVNAVEGDAEMFIDMISFAPIYEVEATKKLFSKTSYKEIPKGFELKKNIHIKYTDAKMLDKLVTFCAEEEIYDLVRVEYFVEDIEAKKAEMIAKAEEILIKKMTRYERLLGENFDDKNKRMGEGFLMHYPIEQYKAYQAYCSNSLLLKPEGGPAQTTTSSQFYMPKMNKGYDFVINSSYLEPVVQLEYELVIDLQPKPEKVEQPKEIIKTETEIKKEVYIINQDGKLVKIGL